MNLTEQKTKLEGLIKSATNPKQKAMYEKLIRDLEAKQATEEKQSQPATKPTRPIKSKPQLIQPHNLEKVENKVDLGKIESSDLFQAIGVIKGVVFKTASGEFKIRFKDKIYSLLPKNKNTTNALELELKNSNISTKRLIVYPKILHFPRRDQPHIVGFQLVGFDTGDRSGVAGVLNDFEFILRGLFQFIPVCRQPCITIQRNFTKQRVKWIKDEEDSARKAKFMKASHIPVLWRDSPVKPFRFNPRLDPKDQGSAKFVQIKAEFIPGRDVFGFLDLIDQPCDPPNYLKVSNKDKAAFNRQKAIAAKNN